MNVARSHLMTLRDVAAELRGGPTRSIGKAATQMLGKAPA